MAAHAEQNAGARIEKAKQQWWDSLLPPSLQGIILDYLPGKDLMALMALISTNHPPQEQQMVLGKLASSVATMRVNAHLNAHLDVRAFNNALRETNTKGAAAGGKNTEAVVSGEFILDALQLDPSRPEQPGEAQDYNIYINVDIEEEGNRAELQRRKYTPIEEYLWSIATPACLNCVKTNRAKKQGLTVDFHFRHSTMEFLPHESKKCTTLLGTGRLGPHCDDYSAVSTRTNKIRLVNSYVINNDFIFQVIGTSLSPRECLRRSIDFRCLVNYWNGKKLDICYPEDISKRVARQQGDYTYSSYLHQVYRAAKYIRKGFVILDDNGIFPTFFSNLVLNFWRTSIPDWFYAPLFEEMNLLEANAALQRETVVATRLEELNYAVQIVWGAR